MPSDADDAYASALAAIRDALRRAEDALDLTALAGFGALDRLPPEIASLSLLQSLDLSGTDIADLAPLARMTGLRELGLSYTPVADLAPLRGLTGLRSLDLSVSRVEDIAPLSGLTALGDLFISGTPFQRLSGLRTETLSQSDLRARFGTPEAPAPGVPATAGPAVRSRGVPVVVDMTRPADAQAQALGLSDAMLDQIAEALKDGAGLGARTVAPGSPVHLWPCNGVEVRFLIGRTEAPVVITILGFARPGLTLS